jgi:hypothetical protein
MSGWPARFAGVVARPRTWRTLAYLLLALPTGLVYFIVLVVGVSTGVALAIVIVGLGILIVTLAAWRGMASIERSLARRLLGVAIPNPPDRRGLPRLERVTRWLRDLVTWKSLIFVALKFPLGVITFALVVGVGFFSLVLLLAPLIVIGTPVTVFGWIFESSLEALPLTLLGIIACLLWLNGTNGLGWLWVLYARVMLGPSTAALHERVDDLRDARARAGSRGRAAQRHRRARRQGPGTRRRDLPGRPGRDQRHRRAGRREAGPLTAVTRRRRVTVGSKRPLEAPAHPCAGSGA